MAPTPSQLTRVLFTKVPKDVTSAASARKLAASVGNTNTVEHLRRGPGGFALASRYLGPKASVVKAVVVVEEPKPKKPTTNKKPRKVTEKSKKTQERTVKAQRKKSTETPSRETMREQLVVNAGVMIREHFRKRLRAYVLIKFGKTGDDLTSEEEKASKKLVGQIMYACYNMRDVLTPDGEEWSEKWIPWPDNIKKNGMEFYIRLIWEFQSVVEDRMEAVPNEKGDWNMPQVKISTASFKVMRWTVMRRAFAIDRFETRKEECPLSKTEFLQLPVEEKYEHASHLFANEIKSDGYSASVLYYRPKHEELGGEDASLSSDSILECVRCVQQLGNTFDYKLHDDVVGESSKRARHRNNRDIVSAITREYRHLAGFNRFRAWNESQKRKFPDYKSVIEGMPSFKTSSYEKYLKRLDYFWQHAVFLLRFCLDRPYLNKTDRTDCKQAHVRSLRGLEPTRWHKGSRSKSGQGVEGGAAEARDGGFHGRVQDEQALLAVPPVTFQRAVPDFGLPQERPETQEEEDEGKKRGCEARYWDRDVNAAINMLELLKSEVQGRGRMEPFRRS
ncbi:hypothetical protein GQ600_1513 [Phytophthora cactorum]|nr:hypothetical protein GQ600_1513 [Phytophthora cactorum]